MSSKEESNIKITLLLLLLFHRQIKLAQSRDLSEKIQGYFGMKGSQTNIKSSTEFASSVSFVQRQKNVVDSEGFKLGSFQFLDWSSTTCAAAFLLSINNLEFSHFRCQSPIFWSERQLLQVVSLAFVKAHSLI